MGPPTLRRQKCDLRGLGFTRFKVESLGRRLPHCGFPACYVHAADCSFQNQKSICARSEGNSIHPELSYTHGPHDAAPTLMIAVR